MENATLVLKVKDATSNTPNTLNTWNNISLRNVLGPMYYKYDKFNLCLVNISTGQSNAALGNTIDDLNVCVNVSGLPFINQTYNVASGNMTSSTCITTFQFVRGSCVNQYFYGNNYFTFGKSQDLCNITIALVKVSDYTSSLNGAGQTYPNVTYIFSIIGIPNDDSIKPPVRMDRNTGHI